ncbi:uncharacterized protein LOC126576689 [Anopheles aquasalis]|uniref:uncharacterized protein LOC126576689 n=1 Tax=Anopheles aquasalis TaxID=42839 RepID=UPI00215B2E92|nr:uncharacterized protein LOC126576689 [Anopheles aquasalis]
MLLNVHPLASASYHSGSSLIHRSSHRLLLKQMSLLERYKCADFHRHPLHQSRSLLCFRGEPLSKSSSSSSIDEKNVLTQVKQHQDQRAQLPVDKRISLFETLRNVQWTATFRSCRQGLTVHEALRSIRHLPANMVTGYWMVKNSREYELTTAALVTTWKLTVRVAHGAYFWFGVFLESREYFYLRYYTLLLLEHTIRWLRIGLKLSFDTMRMWIK